MTSKKKVIVNTPIGKAKWFKLVTPDEKYKKYSLDLIVEDGPEIQSLIAKIEEMTAEAIEETRELAKPAQKKKVKDSGNRPIEEEYDQEGNPTGRFVIKMRQNSIINTKEGPKKAYPPKLFDAQGGEIKGTARDTLQVFNGSELRANIELSKYGNVSIGCGVSIRPKAAQIIKIQSGSEFGGFDAVETDGGFVMEEEDNSTPFTAQEPTGAPDF